MSPWGYISIGAIGVVVAAVIGYLLGTGPALLVALGSGILLAIGVIAEGVRIGGREVDAARAIDLAHEDTYSA